MGRKVSTNGEAETVKTEKMRQMSTALNDEDRAALKELSDLKYFGLAGMTTVLREEGMPRVREEIARIKEATMVREAA